MGIYLNIYGINFVYHDRRCKSKIKEYCIIAVIKYTENEPSNFFRRSKKNIYKIC